MLRVMLHRITILAARSWPPVALATALVINAAWVGALGYALVRML